jgi:hypothetical protein
MSTSPQQIWTLQKIEEFIEELASAYRSLVNGQQVAAAAHLRELLPVYAAELLPYVDQRIVECHALIKRGLRDEALGRASEPPDLLRIANILDLDRFVDEVASWKAASDVVGLVWPVAPRSDLLGYVIEAEARVTELRPLLDTWRRLNLRHAPLPARISLLRRLQSQDANNEVWRDLLATHESFRFTEIKAALDRLAEQVEQPRLPDGEALATELCSLIDELEGEWGSEQLPDRLKRRAVRLETRVRERRVDATLDRLAPELDTAYAALADTLASDRRLRLDYLRQLAEGWHEALRDRGVIAQADPRLKRVRPALDYVARLMEVDNLLLEVGQAVSQRPERFKDRLAWSNELDRTMDRIDTAVAGLAPVDVDVDRIAALSDRVARVAGDVGREGRLRRAVLAAGVAALVAAGGFVSWLSFDHRRHEALVAETVTTLWTEEEQLQQGMQRDVTTIDRDWSDRLRADPRVATALDRLREESRTQETRRDRLRQLVEETRAAIATAQQANRPQPLAPWPVEFATASRALDLLRQEGLAVTDQEQALLEGPAASLRVLATNFTRAADDALITAAKELELKLAAVDALLLTDVEKADAMLTDVEQRVDALRALTTTTACAGAATPHGAARLVSPAAAAAVSPQSPLMKRLGDVLSKRGAYAGLDARDAKADELLDRGDFGAYADALRAIATEVRDHPAAEDYPTVADDHLYWKALADWEALLPRIHAAVHASSDEAQQLRKVLAGLSPEVGSLPFVREAKTWLDPLLARTETCSGEKIALAVDGLKWLLEGQYGATIDAVAWEHDAPDPKPLFYFLLRDRPLPDRSRGVEPVIGWPNKGIWKKNRWIFKPDAATVADSPQKRVAARSLEILDGMPHEGATALAVDRIALETLRTCASTPGGAAFDPCIQALLLRYVTLEVCELSSFLKARLQRSLRFIDAGKTPEGQERQIRGADNIAFTLVLDPESQHTEAVVLAARKSCSDFVQTVRDEIDAATRQLDDEESALADKHKTLTGYTCVGRLRRLPGGGWAISGGTPARRKGQPLYVLDRNGTGIDVVPCVTGDEEGTIPAGTKVRGRAGQPVYVRLTIEETL